MSKQGYIYILANYNKTSLYVGVTSDLIKRVYEHKHKLIVGHTAKYYIDRLVYYEQFEDIKDAIAREKQLKGGSRQKKMDLINSFNPEWKDLYDEIL
ncbi:MAG: hypothetical protein A2Y25_07125 [Candidatus Melainabacteria bacterium GWF2_37_15]|nr:MAG: hypothetical protein A2Y25_07125 [Candidatus Melainabacteria bacterium GWF2_37_15]